MIIVMIMNLGGAFDMVGTVLMWIALALTIISLVEDVYKRQVPDPAV